MHKGPRIPTQHTKAVFRFKALFLWGSLLVVIASLFSYISFHSVAVRATLGIPTQRSPIIIAAHQNTAVPTTNLPATQSDIHLAAISGTYNASRLNATSLIGYVLWGDHPATYLPSVANHARYCKFGQDSSDAASEFTWLKRNHPDWITYTQDRRTPAYYHIGNYTDRSHIPLDFTNGAVQDYVVQQCLLPALAQGYTGVGFDHGTTLNPFSVVGHFDTQGHWIQLYSGAYNDPAYRTAATRAFAQLTQKMRAVAQTQGKSLLIAVNDYPDLQYNDNYTDLMPYLDIVFDEAGFTGLANNTLPYLTSKPIQGTTTTNGWYLKVQDLIKVQQTMGKAVIVNALEPYTIDMNHPPQQKDVQWILANYLLVKYDHTYSAFIISRNASYNQQNFALPEFLAKVGTPTTAIQFAQNVYMRKYSQGLALVNPSLDQSYTVNLPSGTYKDLHGNGISTIIMSPHSGLVLQHV